MLYGVRNKDQFVGFQVLTTAGMKPVVFWSGTVYSGRRVPVF